MKAWLRGVARQLGLLTTEDGRRYEAEIAARRKHADALEARVDVLELMAANMGHFTGTHGDDARRQA